MLTASSNRNHNRPIEPFNHVLKTDNKLNSGCNDPEIDIFR